MAASDADHEGQEVDFSAYSRTEGNRDSDDEDNALVKIGSDSDSE